MSRLIDADVLSDQMYHEAFETDTEMQRWDSGCWIRYKLFENALCNAPTIEERKTGKWVPDPRNVYEMRFVCTNCMTSAKVPTIGFTAYKPVWGYCPNCGAKMEVENQ